VTCFSPISGVAVPICQYAGGQAQYGLSVTDPAKYAGAGTYKIMTIQMRTLALTPSSVLQFTNKLNDAVCGPGCIDYGAASGYTNGTVTITNPPTPTRTPTLCYGCPTPTPTPTQPPLTIRINAGGSAYTDHDGNPWVADKAWTPGSWGYVGGGGQTYASDTPVSGTQDSTLYQSERYGMSEFRFDVSPGLYSVTLRFAEIYYKTKPGDRVFSVNAEGNPVVTNLDVMTAAGGQNIALDRSFPVTVSDSQLNLEFVGVTGNAKINALQVLYMGGSGPTATATATASPTRTPTSAVSATPTLSPTASRTSTATPTPRDPYEVNDSFDQAYGIEQNRDYLGYIESPDDNDYFKFTVSDPSVFIWVSLTDLPADYDLFLYRPDRSLVAWSNYGGRASEYVLDYPAGGVTGVYYILVVGYGKAYDVTHSYRLHMDLHTATPTPTPSLTPSATPTRQPLDQYEPNNTFDQATNISPGVYTAYMDSINDIDYFKFTVSAAGKTVVASLTQLPADYDLYLANPGRNFVTWSRYGGTANEYIFFRAAEAGTYYLMVAGYNHAYDPANSYRLTLQIQ
jgi:hypothetical protein